MNQLAQAGSLLAPDAKLHGLLQRQRASHRTFAHDTPAGDAGVTRQQDLTSGDFP
jgi:hypothetical protein